MINPHSLRGILPRGSTLFVAVSGGKDSVALIHSLWRIKGELGTRIVAYHINLGIPTFSERSEEVVRSLSRDLGIPLVIHRPGEGLRFHGPQGIEGHGQEALLRMRDRQEVSPEPRPPGTRSFRGGHRPQRR